MRRVYHVGSFINSIWNFKPLLISDTLTYILPVAFQFSRPALFISCRTPPAAAQMAQINKKSYVEEEKPAGNYFRYSFVGTRGDWCLQNALDRRKGQHKHEIGKKKKKKKSTKQKTNSAPCCTRLFQDKKSFLCLFILCRLCFVNFLSTLPTKIETRYRANKNRITQKMRNLTESKNYSPASHF